MEKKRQGSWYRKINKGMDSEMIEYCFLFKYNLIKYLFYNGNSFGKSGIGYAVLGE